VTPREAGSTDRRDEPRAALSAAVWEVITAGGRALVEGPAGIGKTTVIRTLSDRAVADDWLVLAAAPTEAEQELPYAALIDVVEPIVELSEQLPELQRAALIGVSAIGASPAAAGGTVAAATRALLGAALRKHDGAVLVVLDDTPWLDPASRRALEFALRRSPVPVLVGLRNPPAVDEVPLSLDRPIVGDPLVRFRLEPLGTAELQQILDAVPGRRLSRHLVQRIAEESGGNPLLALQIDRAVRQLRRPPLPTDDLPAIGGSALETATHALERLPAEAVAAVRTAALLTVPRLDHLSAVGFSPAAFDAAENAGLVRLTVDEVEFAHPTFAAAARLGLDPSERRRIHGRLADAVHDPDERVRQLAHATAEPDEIVAAELMAAATRLRDRGATAAAAGLFLRAAELTPPEHREAGWRRSLAAAMCRLDMGDVDDVRELVQPVIDASSGETRALAMLMMARVLHFGEEPARARELAVEALQHVEAGSLQAGRVQTYVAYFGHDHRQMAQDAAAAVDVLERSGGDPELLTAARVIHAFTAASLGEQPPADLLQEAVAVRGDEARWLIASTPGNWYLGVDDHVRSREFFTGQIGVLEIHGDEPNLMLAYAGLGMNELFAARYDEAERCIRLCRDLAERVGSETNFETAVLGQVAAARGDLDAARTYLDRLPADGSPTSWTRLWRGVLGGRIAHLEERHRDACEAFAGVVAVMDAQGVQDYAHVRFEPDWVASAVAIGDVDQARGALAFLERRQAAIPRPWAELGIARCRLLVAAASGADVAGPLHDLQAALDRTDAVAVPLERAQCHLVAGATHRRARRRALAREQLTVAAADFERVGARLLAERAHAELARIGGRQVSTTELTEGERRVAELAATGATNQEIADLLYLSPKTVEATLSRAFRKLGVSRRTELVRALAGRG